MNQISWRHAGSIGVVLIGALIFIGCEEDPFEMKSVPMYDISYDAFVTTDASTDSVLVLYVLGDYMRSPFPEFELLPPGPSPDDSVKINIRVVGWVNDPNYRAPIVSKWRGDTLKIWCSIFSLEGVEQSPVLSKNTPDMQWVQASHFSVEVPVGVGVRFLLPADYWEVGW